MDAVVQPIAATRVVLRQSFRGTLAPICETSRPFAAVSAQVFVSENRDLASQLASYNFLSEPAENTKRREVAAHECFRLAGLTGLEPATSGVTDRRSKQLIICVPRYPLSGLSTSLTAAPPARPRSHSPPHPRADLKASLCPCASSTRSVLVRGSSRRRRCAAESR